MHAVTVAVLYLLDFVKLILYKEAGVEAFLFSVCEVDN